MSGFIINPSRFASAASNYMQDVVSSCCVDLDATISASYGGSGQTWSNLIPSPADGAAQTDYDFWLGADGTATTDDPTFTGSAGDPAAYFAMDGGDHFQLKTFSATQDVLWNMHRTDSSKPWWVAICFYCPSGAKAGFWGTGWIGSDVGLYLHQDEAGGVIYSGTGGVLNSVGLTSDTYTADDPNIIIISGDNNATTNNLKSWHDTKTGTTYSKTWTSNTNNPTNQFHIGSADQATPVGFMLANSRIYAWSCGNELLDDTKAGAIIDEYNARHSRTYA